MNSEIAARLGCGRNWVTNLLKRTFASRGITMPDGRARRRSLPKKQVNPTMRKQIADEAKALSDEGLADLQIAVRLGCSPPTAAAAVDFWYTSRGLAAPTHADRRAALVDRMFSHHQQDRSIREIAQDVGMCTRSVTLLLRERFQSLGLTLPDGRTRRGLCKESSNGNAEAKVNEAPPHAAAP
jgi:site-specific DNA recombinase